MFGSLGSSTVGSFGAKSTRQRVIPEELPGTRFFSNLPNHTQGTYSQAHYPQQDSHLYRIWTHPLEI
jgi:hypothetical protein